MLRPFLWLIGVFSALLLGCVMPTLAADAKDAAKVPEIPVVTTWGDILKQKPIAIGGGVNIRLGIEAKKAPVNSGVLLYCLTERFQPPKTWSRSDLIGPVAMSHSQCALDGPSTETDNLRLITGFGLEASREQSPELGKFRLLFVREVYFVRKGKFDVLVAKLDGKPLAVAKMDATDQVYQSWIPWDQLSDSGKTANPAEFVLANRANGIALPYVMSLRPVIGRGVIEGRKVNRQPSERLPKLTPDTENTGLRLSVSHGKITIESDAGINIWGPGTLFLTRWWINGKPFIPTQSRQSERRRTGGVGTSETRVHILHARLQLDLQALGAKKGDKIGLQLLHCDDGWEWVTGGISIIPKGWESDVLPELSNRVDFTAE